MPGGFPLKSAGAQSCLFLCRSPLPDTERGLEAIADLVWGCVSLGHRLSKLGELSTANTITVRGIAWEDGTGIFRHVDELRLNWRTINAPLVTEL